MTSIVRPGDMTANEQLLVASVRASSAEERHWLLRCERTRGDGQSCGHLRWVAAAALADSRCPICQAVRGQGLTRTPRRPAALSLVAI